MWQLWANSLKHSEVHSAPYKVRVPVISTDPVNEQSSFRVKVPLETSLKSQVLEETKMIHRKKGRRHGIDGMFLLAVLSDDVGHRVACT